jgi:RNA polymerase sigma-32 factor
LRLVVAISRNYLGYGLPQADLIQEGNIGLMKAVRRFDPERGVRLVSFALHWIKAEIHEHILRNWRLVKIVTTKGAAQAVFQPASMKPSSQSLTPAEARHIAQALNVKPEEVLEMETRLTGQEVALDPPAGDEGETMTPIAYLTDTDAEPAQILERAETTRNRSSGLKSALAQLDDRSREIIEARWLREDDDAATLQTLADRYGVSAERIRQDREQGDQDHACQMGTVQ